VLIDSLSVSHVVIGYDFIFGHKRRGDAELLKQFARDEHFGVTQLSAVSDNAVIYSSTATRKAIADGDMEEAKRLLGRPFTVFGTVVEGDQKGRTIGFPTANIDLGNYIRPKYGVYAVDVLYNEKRLAGVANIGVRPSVESKRELLEVFIFDFSEDLYDQELQIEFVSYIRPEQRFESLQQLQLQIEKDCQSAKQILRVES
jgi:riboflavin kinase/FMN adenylyltransferase